MYYAGKYRGAVHSIFDIKFNVPNKIPVVFQNGSNYDYLFIIKELWGNLRENLNVLRKILKNKTFFIPIEKSDTKWKIKSIDSTRFMAASSSNLVDNLAEGINKIKCKDCDCFLEYENV